jgi:hypothetical protein
MAMDKAITKRREIAPDLIIMRGSCFLLIRFDVPLAYVLDFGRRWY